MSEELKFTLFYSQYISLTSSFIIEVEAGHIVYISYMCLLNIDRILNIDSNY